MVKKEKRKECGTRGRIDKTTVRQHFLVERLNGMYEKHTTEVATSKIAALLKLREARAHSS